jgi:hypothetical protein
MTRVDLADPDDAESAGVDLRRRWHRWSSCVPRAALTEEPRMVGGLIVVSGLVRTILILYPQRDSNPCCRLERAKS